MAPDELVGADRLMVMSIHPRHVQAILRGTKTVELRRTRPDIEPGQPVAIYATTPSAALVATCQIARIQVDTPARLWAAVHDNAAVRRQEYDDYFGGAEVAVALHLSAVTPLTNAVTLSQMRSAGPFTPPQTWHFFDRRRLSALLGRHPSTPVLTGLLSELTAGLSEV
jgi:predicted transcriptional regulator